MIAPEYMLNISKGKDIKDTCKDAGYDCYKKGIFVEHPHIENKVLFTGIISARNPKVEPDYFSDLWGNKINKQLSKIIEGLQENPNLRTYEIALTDPYIIDKEIPALTNIGFRYIEPLNTLAVDARFTNLDLDELRYNIEDVAALGEAIIKDVNKDWNLGPVTIYYTKAILGEESKIEKLEKKEIEFESYLLNSVEGLYITDVYEDNIQTCLENGIMLPNGRGKKGKTLLHGICFVGDPLHCRVSDKSPSDESRCITYALGYILLSTKKDESYTYGYQINKNNQLDKAIKKLIKNPNSVVEISVEEPRFIDEEDPPCMRKISLYVNPLENKLNLNAKFRSWALYDAANENLYGLSELQKHVVYEMNKEGYNYDVGSLTVFYKNADLREDVLDFAKNAFAPQKTQSIVEKLFKDTK
jgi:thymidylate synthase